MTVLIAAPIGGLKQYSLALWLQWIADQEYKDYDFCLCLNGRYCHDLLKKINLVEIRDIHGQEKKPVKLMLMNSSGLTVIQKITYAREKIRRYAVSGAYSHIFWLDTDTIPANKNAISLLMDRDKESVSGLYHYKHSSVPVMIDKDTHTNVNSDKLEKAAIDRKLIEIWGSGYGCLLHDRRAIAIPFDYDLFGEERTDDFGHCHALEQAGIRRWLDPFILCKHFSSSEESLKVNDMLQLNAVKINKD